MRKKLQFELRFFEHKYPAIAIGFISGWSEFLLVLWIIDFRISWRY